VKIVIAVSLTIVLFLLLLLPLSHDSVGAACTSDQKDALDAKGWSKSQITKFCGASKGKKKGSDDDDDDAFDDAGGGKVPPASGANGPASVCITNFGTCQMMVPVAIGAPCVCRVPQGTFPGQAR
jgi:hypothetical protein